MAKEPLAERKPVLGGETESWAKDLLNTIHVGLLTPDADGEKELETGRNECALSG